MKIRIIGCSGSGKSFLADSLSASLNIKHYDLDNIFWDNSSKTYGVKRNPLVRDQQLKKIMSKDEWIIEGVQYSWALSTFAEADAIIFLNPSALKCRMSILKRYVKRKYDKNSYKKETFSSVVDLLKWTQVFYEKNVPEIKKILEEYKEKTCITADTDKAIEFINRLTIN